MRCLPRAFVAAATFAACSALAALGPAYALAAGAIRTGGVAAGATVAPSQAGGSQYGVSSRSAAGPPPVVSLFDVPGSVVAGKPPVVRLRVDSARAGTVRVKVVLYESSLRDPLLAIDMGWVHTARTLDLRWPRGTRLAPGSYHLALGVHGHRAGPARVFAHASRFAQLVVTAPAPTPPPLPTGVPTPAQSAALGAVFPVAGAHSFGGPENRFGAPRTGHIHEGQDVLTAEGTPVVAPLAGTIITTGYQASAAGYYAAEHTSAGLDFFFAHCRAASLLVKAGEAVAAGRQLCAAGQSGDATAPHLHFEIWLGGWRAPGGYAIDPLLYLEAWEHAGR
jgi:murein DD-endopeptidase MepM/ murein hydrolase activator NlpD